MLENAPKKRVLNIAHRGARSLAPENTLAAARKALETRADMWELDVGVTADGELIVIHDSSLERTSNVTRVFPNRHPWRVADFTLAEVRSLDFGSWFLEQDPFGQIASGAIASTQLQSYVGERAPTLREALLFTRSHDWRVNIEIKDLGALHDGDEIVSEVVALVEELGMIRRVLVSSFNHDYLERAKNLNPEIRTGVLLDQPVADPATLLYRLHADAYHPLVDNLRVGDIADLRARGFDVNVWVVNEEPRMRELKTFGVSGIFTDFPQVLAALV